MAARLLSVTPLLCYACLCLLGQIQFRLWSQVIYLWDSNFTAADILVDYHGIRYLLVLPIFLFAEWSERSYDVIFSWTAPLLVFVIAWFSTESTIKLGGNSASSRRALVFSGISLFFILISLSMNGRLMFAMAGSSILLWALLHWQENHYLKNFIAVLASIFLCSVSSGTFLMAILAFYFFLLVNLVLDDPSLRQHRQLLLYLGLLVLLMPYLSMLVIKIMEYFNDQLGSLGYMLSHGYGTFLMRANTPLLAAGILTLAGLAYAYRRIVFRYWIISSMALFCLAGGMVGISTMLILLPPLLVVSSLLMLKIFDRFDISLSSK